MIITRGVNKGKLCRDANQWCKHNKITCTHCKKTFNYLHTYTAHVCAVADQTSKIKINVKTKTFPQFQVITDDLYDQIVNQVGKRECIRFLFQSMDLDIVTIVDKVYLSGKDKDQYPIACKNKTHFRFIGTDHKLVDDINGNLIVSTVIKSVQNAYLKASADLIQGHMEDNQIDTLYKKYDIRSVHKRIKQISTTVQRERLRQGLVNKVTNPIHPFFQC